MDAQRRDLGDGGSYLRLLALDALHALESIIQRTRTLVQTIPDTIILLLIQFVAGLAWTGRVHHRLQQTLPHHRRAQTDTDELVDLLLDQGVEADQLEVAAAVAALTHHPLGGTVQGDQLDVVVLAGMLLLQLAETLLERGELAVEDVCLVDLIGHDD